MVVNRMINLQRRRRGFSLIELLIVIAIILVIIMLAAPRFSAAQRMTRETSAMVSIRTIHTAQVQYQSQYGKYAGSLTELGPPTSGAASASGAGLIDGTLAAGEKDQYKFAITGNGAGYVINANPLTYGKSGNRTFYSDESMTLRQNNGAEPATATSPEVK